MIEPSEIDNDVQTYNPGHQIEGLDRCWTLILMCDQLLSGHPAVVRAEGQTLLRQACEALSDLYQKIGQLDDEPEQ